MTRERRLSLTGAAALLVALPLVAQAQTTLDTPEVFFACYGSLTGVVYRIKEPGLPTNCLHRTHVQFSWTSGDGGAALTEHGALQGLLNDDHPQYALVDGSRALTGALNLGTQKITNLAAATAAGEAVPFEQAVKSGDAAGGDLSGTHPNPTVAKLQGTAVSPTAPTSGQVLAFNGTSWSPAESPTGGGETISRTGTGHLTLPLGSGINFLPGLAIAIDIPANGAAIISTDGGVQTSTGEANAIVYVDIDVLIDGLFTSFRRRVVAMNTSGFGDVMANWSMRFSVLLAPGRHSISVHAQVAKGNTGAIVSDDNGDPLRRGVLTVTAVQR